MNPLNDISKVYMKEVLKPQIGKPAEKGGEQKRGGTDEESSAKRIRQAVYDIRYRAKEKNLELPQAYAQYIGGSQMSGEEKNAVKEKLGLSESVVSEEEERYSVRITDKEGKTKYEKKTRTQISALRADPTISSVEMSKSGGESRPSGKLDPVGKEDSDVDNDGKPNTKSDKYLMNRRKAIGKAIAKENKFYSWRDSLIEVTKTEKEEGLDRDKPIKEKNDINNKIRINPVVKEEIEALGGMILESEEDASIFSGILEVDYYHMTDKLLESILHEFYEECLEEGLDLLEVRKEIVRTLAIESELLDEATVSAGHDTKIPKEKKEKTNTNVTTGHDSKDKESTKGVGARVKKEKMGTLRTLAKKAYNVSPKKVVDKTKDAYNSETGKRVRAGLKKGLKKVGKRLSKTADNIAGRMFSEEGPSDMSKAQDEARRKQGLNQKERLMKKQQMLDRTRLQMQKQGKLPTSRMEEVESVDEAMRPGERQRKMAAKRHDPYATSRDRATAHNVAVRNDGPGTPGYEKKSTGGKGARYAGYGDQGAGNKARRRAGQEPLRGNTRKEEVEQVSEADMTGAPSIKDAKPAKKTNVKYDKHMKVMAPTIKKEETEDSLRDRRMERGGVDGNVDYRRPARTATGPKKKPSGNSMSAFDKVVGDLKAKYGDKAIMAKKTQRK